MAVMGLHPLHPIDFRQLEMRHQAPHFGDRTQPEIFCLTLAIRMSRSLRLFVNGTAGSCTNRRISASCPAKASCRFSASGFALGAGRRLRAFPLSPGQDGPAAFPHGPGIRLGQPPVRALADLAGGLLHEPLHAPGPGMAAGVDDEPEIAQQAAPRERSGRWKRGSQERRAPPCTTILKANGLRPRQARTFKVSRDPWFEIKSTSRALRPLPWLSLLSLASTRATGRLARHLHGTPHGWRNRTDEVKNLNYTRIPRATWRIAREHRATTGPPCAEPPERTASGPGRVRSVSSTRPGLLRRHLDQELARRDRHRYRAGVLSGGREPQELRRPHQVC